MRVFCGWHLKNFGFELEMEPKDGKGLTGKTTGMCKQCKKIEWACLPKRPARWNLVGRFLARRRKKKRVARTGPEAEEQVEELERMRQIFVENPGLHALVMLRGQRGLHYIPNEDLAELQSRFANEPEMKCHWN